MTTRTLISSLFQPRRGPSSPPVPNHLRLGSDCSNRSPFLRHFPRSSVQYAACTDPSYTTNKGGLVKEYDWARGTQGVRGGPGGGWEMVPGNGTVPTFQPPDKSGAFSPDTTQQTPLPPRQYQTTTPYNDNDDALHLPSGRVVPTLRNKWTTTAGTHTRALRSYKYIQTKQPGGASSQTRRVSGAFSRSVESSRAFDVDAGKSRRDDVCRC
ncbi:hypothetical protein VTG60DRAFT_4787 [Thermothelomyces hinnuleus]